MGLDTSARGLRCATCLFLGLVVAISLGAQEEAADPLQELLAAHYEALGGLEEWKAIDSFHLTGVATVQGFEVPFAIWNQRPGFFRQQNDIQGMLAITAYDGVQAWGTNPMAGQADPAPLPAEQAAAAAAQANIDGPLIAWRAMKAKLELGEVVDLGEELGQATLITATLADGTVEKYYLGVEDPLVVRQVRPVPASLGGGEVVTDILEWREVEGVRVPSKQRTQSPMMGTVEIDIRTTEANVEIDPDLFYMPGQMADAALTLEQVLEKHFAARGAGTGAVSTVRATGKLGFMGLQVPLVITLAKPNKSRLEADMAGNQMILAYDGEQAWTVSPLQAILEPQALPPEAADLIELFGGFLWGILEGSQEKGWTLELAGIEKVERDETYRIDMKNEAGVVRSAYLGGEDFLERRFSLNANFMGTQQDIDALLSDYENKAGLLVPQSISLQSGGTEVASVSLEDVETGVEFAEDIFSLPPPAESGE